MPGESHQFGDFQTPEELALKVCLLLRRIGAAPASVIEPTCGTGSFLRAAETAYPYCGSLKGYEINRAYAEEARAFSKRSSIECGDFFSQDWDSLLGDAEEPILVLGNPPWVTNSEMGRLNGNNLPEKSNVLKLKGIEAVTGKSNFDISEWMIFRLLQAMSYKSGTLAMLCKTSVARTVRRRAWENEIGIERAAVYGIDAKESFGAAVSACLLVCNLRPGPSEPEMCSTYRTLEEDLPCSAFGLRDGQLVADFSLHSAYGHLQGTSPLVWRSGVKHDCASVMNLRMGEEGYVNGMGETVCLEDDVVYPMLKSTELMKEHSPSRFMLVTQRQAGESTDRLARETPLAWEYLTANSDMLDARASSIYRNRPRFSIFGIGEYSFAPWKVAISGFSKRLDFKTVGPANDKPVMLDDACYFLPCETEEQAGRLTDALNSKEARGFLGSLIFWDNKRPITSGILSCLDLDKLTAEIS